jgi:hypothetical protein
MYTKQARAPSDTEVVADFKPSLLANWDTKYPNTWTKANYNQSLLLQLSSLNPTPKQTFSKKVQVKISLI